MENKVEFVLAGSIRNEASPDVITDASIAPDAIHRFCRKPRLAIIVAVLLHSAANGTTCSLRTSRLCGHSAGSIDQAAGPQVIPGHWHRHGRLIFLVRAGNGTQNRLKPVLHESTEYMHR